MAYRGLFLQEVETSSRTGEQLRTGGKTSERERRIGGSGGGGGDGGGGDGGGGDA